MSKRYVELIDEQIAEHERAIAKLAIAREVVAALGDALGGAGPKLGIGKPSRAATARSGLRKGQRYEVIEKALTTLARPATSKEIYAQIRASHAHVQQKTIWNALYSMREIGKIERLEDGRYSLPKAEDLPLMATE